MLELKDSVQNRQLTGFEVETLLRFSFTVCEVVDVVVVVIGVVFAAVIVVVVDATAQLLAFEVDAFLHSGCDAAPTAASVFGAEFCSNFEPKSARSSAPFPIRPSDFALPDTVDDTRSSIAGAPEVEMLLFPEVAVTIL